MTLLLRRLARVTTRYPRRTALALVVALLAGIAVGTSAAGRFVDDFTVPGIESQRAQDLIAQRFPGQGGDGATIVLTAREGAGGVARSGAAGGAAAAGRGAAGRGAAGGAGAAGRGTAGRGAAGGAGAESLRGPAVAAALARIARLPHVAAVAGPDAPGHTAPGGRTAFATVTYDASAQTLGAAPRARLERATAPLARAGVGVAMAGPIVDAGDSGGAPVGEIAGVLVAVALLLAVLRSLRAAGAALLTALLGVGAGFALLGLAARGVGVPSLAPTLAAMLGLGAGIDYALLSAARHQEELRAGHAPGAAATRANATAGKAALTAALIVLASISGLLVTGIPFVGKTGVAAGIVVLTTAAVTVVLLPPLLAAAGRRAAPRGARGESAPGGAAPVRGVAAPEVASPDVAAPRAAARGGEGARGAAEPPRGAGLAVRRPRLALAIGAAVAAVLVVPATGLRIGQPDDGNLPPAKTQRQAYNELARAFGPGFNGPLVVVDAAPRHHDVTRSAAALSDRIAHTPGVQRVTAPVLNSAKDAALITVFPATPPQAAATAQLVRTLRAQTDAPVGGYTARLVDEAHKIASRLPLFALVVVGLSLLALTLAFRSPLVAALSALLNLVSIAAAYGLVHLLFQTHAGASALGLAVQPVVAYTPLFMFAILFGLSTDYNVFLLARVQEEHERLKDTRQAVARATHRTRRTIAAAATIMIAVFLGFATDADPTIKMTGVGLAGAILIDVTLVRLLLAPAALTLLGDRLWNSDRVGRLYAR